MTASAMTPSVIVEEVKKGGNGRKPYKWVYLFTELDEARKVVGGKWDDVRALLGGKGANLAEMTRIGLPVPPGFTVTTKVCSYFYAHNRSYPPQLKADVEAALAKVEESV